MIENRIVGTGTIRPVDATTAEIVRMSVTPSQRRSGLGRRIVDHLLATARAWQTRVVVLETSSAWRDVVAFYVACGFTITGEREGDFGPDTWFERQLTP